MKPTFTEDLDTLVQFTLRNEDMTGLLKILNQTSNRHCVITSYGPGVEYISRSFGFFARLSVHLSVAHFIILHL